MMNDRENTEYEEAMKLRMDSARENQYNNKEEKLKIFYGAIPPELYRF